MNNAKLYQKSNPLQKRDAQDIINEFSHLFDHKSVGTDLTLLDIGCGAGDVLVELILPKLHDKYTEVIGVDISQEMVKYASEKYRSQFLKFLKVDIQSDFLSPKVFKRPLKAESADFITSFYCLHWIQNQR
jgi:juvenile hormone-III synthase